jgi:hypothetical protein
MTQSPKVPRWAKRALAALLVAGALATPFIGQSARSMTSLAAQTTQDSHGALTVTHTSPCSGSGYPC